MPYLPDSDFRPFTFRRRRKVYRTAVYEARTYGGVTGKAREGLPMSMCAGHARRPEVRLQETMAAVKSSTILVQEKVSEAQGRHP